MRCIGFINRGKDGSIYYKMKRIGITEIMKRDNVYTHTHKQKGDLGTSAILQLKKTSKVSGWCGVHHPNKNPNAFKTGQMRK